MAAKIEITANNVDLCMHAWTFLRDRLDQLALKTDKYPVEFEFGPYRFVFETRADIESLIEQLGSSITDYRACA